MEKIYFSVNYPKDLPIALQIVHYLQNPPLFDIERTQTFASTDSSHSVAFLFDRSKKGIDISTESHFDSGYRVFAFKLLPSEKLDPFKLALTLLNLWPKVLDKISVEKDPFIFTYKYSGTALKREK